MSRGEPWRVVSHSLLLISQKLSVWPAIYLLAFEVVGLPTFLTLCDFNRHHNNLISSC